jgi:hypothetical protein
MKTWRREMFGEVLNINNPTTKKEYFKMSS